MSGGVKTKEKQIKTSKQSRAVADFRQSMGHATRRHFPTTLLRNALALKRLFIVRLHFYVSRDR